MKIIVSLTTWTKRVDQAHLTIQSILNQTRKPDIVEVNLDRENFPNGLSDLPETLLKLQDFGVQFHFEDKDLHCWQKLIPTWRAHKDDIEDWINITLDDDQTYPPNYIEKILKAAEFGDWGCTQHNRLTGGQWMWYKKKVVEQIIDKLTNEVVLECPLDDFVIFHLIKQLKNVRRGEKIDSVPKCRGTGFSFRRNFYPDLDPSKLSQGEYPSEEFQKEFKYLLDHELIALS